MIFDFDNLIEFVKYYNYENNANLQDIDDMPLKVRNALRQKAWNKSAVRYFRACLLRLFEKRPFLKVL